MKSKLLATTLALLALATVPVSAQTTLAEWLPSEGTESGNGLSIPDSAGGGALTVPAGSGTSLEKSQDIPGGGAIVFDGTQTTPLRTVPGFSVEIMDGTRVAIEFLVDGASQEATILSTQALEIRYNPTEGNLETIVYLEAPEGETPYRTVRLRCARDEWQKVLIDLEQGKVQVDLNGQTRSATFQSPLKVEKSALILGSRLLGNTGVRPLKGKIGPVSFSRL